MRVAVCVSNRKQRLDKIMEMYSTLSLKHYTHATPTLFHAFSVVPQLSSWFIVAPQTNNSIGMTKTFVDIAKIAMNTG